MNIHSLPIVKYPRTAHVVGSRLQAGDDGSEQIPLESIAGRHAVIEEKLDGANSGISFDPAGELLLQSRGHYLVGGANERQFNQLKPWASAHADALLSQLGDRYVMYGEWMYAKHSIFYDQLPHWFLEFDLLDKTTDRFLSTPARRELLAGLPVVSVPVLFEGPMPRDVRDLWALVRPSLAKSADWRGAFERSVTRAGLPLDLCWSQTNASDASEGLYIKLESDGVVQARYKLVRPDFTQTILDSGSHHLARPIVPNQLAPGVDLWSATPKVTFDARQECVPGRAVRCQRAAGAPR